MKLTVTLGQMDVHLGDPERNWTTVQQMTAEAARRGSGLILFPELWSTGYDLERATEHASSTESGLFARLAELARTHQIHILGSCLAALDAGKVGNTAVWFDAAGRALGQYSKVHLFRLMEEDQYLTAGDRPGLVETPWGKAGLTICYDLRFPELYRAYALAGARLACVPAEWPHPRLAHWQTLLRARAIENQMFVLACNRVGESKGTRFFGHSAIYDPWGETVVQGGETEMLLTATIDTAQTDAVRARIPVFEDRRPDVYERALQ
jgi:predicted amidohydrolase